jgi:SAM-dependent methyltransferase
LRNNPGVDAKGDRGIAEAPPLEKALTAAVEASAEPHALTNLPAATIAAFVSELAALHRTWLETRDAALPADELYSSKLANGAPLERYELALATAIAERYPVAATRIVEIGTGWGGLAILLARLGFDVAGYEGNAARHAGCSWHIKEQTRHYPGLRKRLRLVGVGLFPEAFRDADLAMGKLNVCIATNITSSYCAEHESAMIEAAAAFDELILDLARFGVPRDAKAEREAFFGEVTSRWFDPVERLLVDEPYEYWRFRSRSIAGRRRSRSFPSTAPGASTSGDQSMGVALPVSGRRNLIATASADKWLTKCPVCHSADFSPLWAIPMTNLPEPLQVYGGYFTQIPTLQVPAPVFCFDFCRDCESIFLNPVPGNLKATYRGNDHYIRKMRRAAEWEAYEALYDKLRSWIPRDATTMIDAACGVGQYLQVARKKEPQRWKRLIGLELAEKYVEHMCNEGLEAHAFDIDNDDLNSLVPRDSIDFAIFAEAFEHVDRPIDALRKLLDVLRPGGRLYFTAQRYGTDVQASVRPGKPIYIGEALVEELPRRLACTIVDRWSSGTRYFVVLEKQAGATRPTPHGDPLGLVVPAARKPNHAPPGLAVAEGGLEQRHSPAPAQTPPSRPGFGTAAKIALQIWRRDPYRTISERYSDPSRTIQEQLAVLGRFLRRHRGGAEILRDLQTLMTRVDGAGLEALRARHAESMRTASATSGYKYLDVVYYTLLKLLLARQLGLDRGPPRRVLDIGTAGGHFPFVCRFFGHDVVGLDIEVPLYESISTCLRVERTIVRVEPYQPLPALAGRFDLITACNTTFNEKSVEDGGPPAYWAPAEWQYFINDLVSNQMRYPGELYIALNPEWRRYPLGIERLVHNRDVLKMAAANGAVVRPRSGRIRMKFSAHRVIQLEEPRRL